MANPLTVGQVAEFSEGTPDLERLDVSDPFVTGILSGLVLTRVDASNFSYTGGEACFNDHTDSDVTQRVTFVNSGSIPLTITSPHETVIVFLQSNGTVLQLTENTVTPAHYRQNCLLGLIQLNAVGAMDADAVELVAIQSRGFAMAFVDFLFSSNNVQFVESGLLLQPNGVNLMLDITSGIVFYLGANLNANPNDPNRIAVTGQSPLTFTSILRDGSRVAVDITTVDVSNYDGGSGLVGMSPNRWGWHVLYRTGTGEMLLQYGQNQDSHSLAGLQGNFNQYMSEYVFAPDFDSSALIVGAVLFARNTTDLSDTANNEVKDRRQFGAGGGFTGGGGGGGDSLWNSTNGDVYRASGNVGIGTPTPQNAMDIEAGDISLSNDRLILQKDTGGTFRSVLQLDAANRLNIYNNALGLGGTIRFLNKPGGGQSGQILNDGTLSVEATAPSGGISLVVQGGGIGMENNVFLFIDDTTNTPRGILSLDSGNVLLINNNALGAGGTIAFGTLPGAVKSVAIDSSGDLRCDSTSGTLVVARVSTAQRDAMTAENGMIVYNTTTNQFNFYENGSWVTK